MLVKPLRPPSHSKRTLENMMMKVPDVNKVTVSAGSHSCNAAVSILVLELYRVILSTRRTRRSRNILKKPPISPAPSRFIQKGSTDTRSMTFSMDFINWPLAGHTVSRSAYSKVKKLTKMASNISQTSSSTRTDGTVSRAMIRDDAMITTITKIAHLCAH